MDAGTRGVVEPRRPVPFGCDAQDRRMIYRWYGQRAPTAIWAPVCQTPGLWFGGMSTRTKGLNAIGLVVADMAATAAFYRLLGLEFTAGSDDHWECELAGGIRLMLDTEESVKSFTPGWTQPSGSPRVGLAFELDFPDAVDATFEQLVAAGYQAQHQPWDAPWGQRYASILDPDGNSVDLYAALPTPA